MTRDGGRAHRSYSSHDVACCPEEPATLATPVKPATTEAEEQTALLRQIEANTRRTP